MDRVRFITHRGKRILLNDFSGTNDSDEVLAAIERCRALVAEEPPESLLTLTFVRDAKFSPEVTDALKQLAADNKAHVKAAAVVGEGALTRMALQMVERFSGRNLAHCDTLIEGKDWLVNQR